MANKSYTKKYSLFDIYLFLLIFLSFIGILITITVSFLFYKYSLKEVNREGTHHIQAMANTIGSPFWIHQELTHIPGTIENFMREFSKKENIVFIRLVLDNGIIEKSNDRKEIGMKVQNLPLFEKKIVKRNGEFNGKKIKEFSLKSKNNDNIWLGISLEILKRNNLLIFLVVSYIIIILFVAIGIAIFIISRRFVIKPLFVLKTAFGLIEQKNYKTQLPFTPIIEMQALFQSFNKMAIKLEEYQVELEKINVELEQRVRQQVKNIEDKIKTVVELEEKVYNLEKTRDNLEKKLKEFM